MDKGEREKLKAQAQMNEYLYSVLNEIGVSVKMDERIGYEFLEIGNMTASFAQPVPFGGKTRSVSDKSSFSDRQNNPYTGSGVHTASESSVFVLMN